MQILAIVCLCVVFAVAYGILHDQVTARICVEYFTVGHPPVFQTEDPTLLGLGWGVIATWWVGVILGVPLALAARVGKRNRKSAADLVRPLALLAGTAALCAFAAGLTGNLLGRSGLVWLVEPLASALPAEKHVPFLTDIWAHSASYGVGFLGGVVLIAWVVWSRFLTPRQPSNAAAPPTGSGALAEG